MISTKHRELESLPVLVTALIISIGLIAFNALYWDIIDVVPLLFFMPDIERAVWVIFLFVAAWCLVHVCRKKRFRRPKAYVPLIIQMITVIIVLTVPFTSIMLDLNFRFHLNQREEIVSKVISGELKPNVSRNYYTIHLPPEYRHLSKGGGDIAIERQGDETYVLFYTYRGILDNFSGFVYRSDDTSPENPDFHGEFFETKRLKQNWYWVAAN